MFHTDFPGTRASGLSLAGFGDSRVSAIITQSPYCKLRSSARLSIPSFITSSPPTPSPQKSLRIRRKERYKDEKKNATMMQPERTDLEPPKDDPFTQEELKAYDGTDASKPVYVAIKGTVFDVTRKRETYGPGGSYAVLAGKDGSRALGLSSLKHEDAVADWSTLEEKERKTLDDWHIFFTKRYNIVGRVVDLPAAVATK